MKRKINNTIKISTVPIIFIIICFSYYNVLNAKMIDIEKKRKKKDFALESISNEEREKLLYLFNNDIGRVSHIVNYSKKNDISPFLTSAVIFAESDNREKAISIVKARGLMQLMLPTAVILLNAGGEKELAEQVIKNPDILYDVELNIKLGTYFLKDLRNMHKSWADALHAYNVGPFAFRYGRRNYAYVSKILTFYNDWEKMDQVGIYKKYNNYLSSIYIKKNEHLAMK